MRTTYISTASLLNTPRTGIQRMQRDLLRLNKEVISGRMADVGLNLGAETGRSVGLHVDTRSLAAFVASNATVTTRLQQSQTALDKLNTGASDFLGKIIQARGSDGKTIATLAQSAFSGFIADANASDGQSYLFGGINSANPPLNDADAGPGAAIDAAFFTRFGFAQDDPLAAGISATDLTDFLDNEFAALFDDPAWGTDWSGASDQAISNRISPTESATTSVSANEPAMRKLAMVYSMVATLGVDSLGAEARAALLDKAASVAGEATSGLTALQANLGTTQNRIKDATERLNVQQTILQQRLGTLEGVDPAEAKIRIDTLTTQIEMSYSLTAKLLQLSLMNYV